MPGYLIQVSASIMCPHGGQISINSTNTRVKAGGQPVTTTADIFTISGCSFMVANKPQPCVKVQWIVPASRVKVGGNPIVLQSSTGLCQSAEQIPQGPPNVTSTQTRVKGT